MKPLDRAAKHFGSKSALARAIGVSPNVVGNWNSRRIPAEQALRIEQVTQGAVTVRDLRPDLYAA